jgi:hypothetical protein
MVVALIKLTAIACLGRIIRHFKTIYEKIRKSSRIRDRQTKTSSPGDPRPTG